MIVHRPGASTFVAAASVLTAGVLAAGLVVTVFATREEPWRPLGPYPVQVVTSDDSVEHADKDLPAVELDGTVRVEAIKCFREAANVSGALSWFSVEPPGLSLLTGGGAAEREKGCVTTTFQNPIPEPVKAWAQARFDEGAPFVVVRITGRDVATRVDGTESEPLTWRTQDFALVPK